jgi:hypothetical protein
VRQGIATDAVTSQQDGMCGAAGGVCGGDVANVGDVGREWVSSEAAAPPAVGMHLPSRRDRVEHGKGDSARPVSPRDCGGDRRAVTGRGQQSPHDAAGVQPHDAAAGPFSRLRPAEEVIKRLHLRSLQRREITGCAQPSTISPALPPTRGEPAAAASPRS